MLTFKWYGQACFTIENSSKIMTDPHNGESVGLNPPPADFAEVVTISHDHHDHASGEKLVARKNSKVLKSSGNYTPEGISVKGIDSFHDKAGGSKRGNNVIFLLEIQGLKICHLGDLGHQLGEEEVEKIGTVDVLLIPVGGNYTINGSEAVEVTKKLNPQVVVPMHFHVEGLTVDIAGPEEFLEEIVGAYPLKEEKTLELEKLPSEKQVVKLDCMAT